MTNFARQSFLGPNSQPTLQKATVGIVGACGGGSHVGQQFAHVGIGSIVIIDPQAIEDTNLNRLIGATQADVERATPKVEIAKRLIKAVRPGTNVVALQQYWQAAGDQLKACDVIVGCLDSIRAKDELDAFCRRFLIPYVDLGMDVHGPDGQHLISGQVVLSTPGMPCLRCFGIVTEKDLAREASQYGEAGGLPQVVWPNGVLASTAVGLTMQLITPWHQDPVDAAYLEYDGNTGIVSPSHRLKLALRRECPHYPANERGDPDFDVRRFVATPSEVKSVGRPRKRIDRIIAWIRRPFG